MDYPKDVKEIKNLNAFIRKAKELETDKYWQDQLSECTLAKNDSWWSRKESPLKWKRHLIQQYLDYKNNKLNECKLIEMKQAPLYDLTNRLDKVKGVTNKHFRNSKHWPKRFKRELDFDYNNSHIRVIDTQMGTFRIFINNNPQINKNNSKFTLDFYDLDEVIDCIINNKLEEKAVIDWNNYLTSKEVKKFLSKDDKNESAKEIIYSEEFEPRYKDLHNPLQAKYKNSWTKKELVNDLANFYYQGNLITENYILKGRENDKSFDIAYNDNKDKLEKFKNELQACHPKITMWIDEDNKTKSLNESKHKIEEKSRNELLAKTKSQTITRYNKAQEYKGFYIRGVDLDDLLKKDSSLVINCQVGNYRDQIEIENVLYWLQYEIEERNHDLQVTSKYVTQALMDAIDGMNIKVNCDCGDFRFRMAYQATKYQYKYGTPENRPAKIRNPDDIGSLCKHLTALLSNKRWLQQITSFLMDFVVENIDKVNQFLRRQPGKEFTVPNERARQLGKQGAYKKFSNRQEAIKDIANDFIEESGDKLFTMNVNLDDDLQRFINDKYDWQKVTPNEFRVIRILVDDYIKENNTEEDEAIAEDGETQE